jgi:hypothetical protein
MSKWRFHLKLVWRLLSDTLRSTSQNSSHQPELGPSTSFRGEVVGSYSKGNKHNKDTMLRNRPNDFTLVARLVNGQPADGKALAQALFSQIGDRAASS